MKICPLCGALLNRLLGLDGHKTVPVPLPWTGRVVESKRMDAVYVCPCCEHCE